MHLIADVLDEQLHDVHDRNSGRIDGIVLEPRLGQPARVTYLEVSPITLLARFSEPLARWYATFDRRLGPGRGTPFRIPWSRVTRNGPLLKMDLDVESTPINALENWLSRAIVRRIPGGR
jgi:hypothetical protein